MSNKDLYEILDRILDQQEKSLGNTESIVTVLWLLVNRIKRLEGKVLNES